MQDNLYVLFSSLSQIMFPCYCLIVFLNLFLLYVFLSFFWLSFSPFSVLFIFFSPFLTMAVPPYLSVFDLQRVAMVRMEQDAKNGVLALNSASVILSQAHALTHQATRTTSQVRYHRLVMWLKIAIF